MPQGPTPSPQLQKVLEGLKARQYGADARPMPSHGPAPAGASSRTPYPPGPQGPAPVIGPKTPPPGMPLEAQVDVSKLPTRGPVTGMPAGSPPIQVDQDYPGAPKVTTSISDVAPVQLGEAGQEYEVKPGDSLWKIAQMFTGSGHNWQDLYRANLAGVANPNIIKIGQKIRIPKEWSHGSATITQEPMNPEPDYNG